MGRCGHWHLPRIVHLPNGVAVINPGSVGLPAYVDDSPLRHVSETGSPGAYCGVLEISKTTLRFALIAIEYDCHHAADQAVRNGRADWAHALSTGTIKTR